MTIFLFFLVARSLSLSLTASGKKTNAIRERKESKNLCDSIFCYAYLSYRDMRLLAGLSLSQMYVID
jgi:hypothetical protein